MQSFVEQLIACLADAGVEFVVVGGVSAVLHGAPVVTQDLDISYRRHPDNVRRLAKALAPFHPQLRGLPPGLPCDVDEHALKMGTNFTLDLGGEPLDLLAEMSGIGGYDQIIANAEEMDVAGKRVKVLALADLIRTKRAAGRPKDLAALPVLEATLDMIQRARGEGTPSSGVV
jgi:predicted nucleotidyltransferase